MLAAHMDEIGFMVTNIDDNGFIRFHTLGGFDPKTLTARVVIYDKSVIGVMGSKPIHLMKSEERKRSCKMIFLLILGCWARGKKDHSCRRSYYQRKRID